MTSPSTAKIPKEAVLKAWQESDIYLLSADTGLGKTTHVPLFLLEHLESDPANTHNANQYKKERSLIWILEPRRAAAQLSALRVSTLLQEQVGKGKVGYETRFENEISNRNKIVYLTYGIFLRKIINSLSLNEVNTVILDEFHERSAEQDFALSFLLNLKACGNPIKIILMSATFSEKLESEIEKNIKFSPVLLCFQSHYFSGQHFSVQSMFWPTKNHPMTGNLNALAAEWAKLILKAHLQSNSGDTLVFLPGMREIKRVEKNLIENSSSSLSVETLHGDIAPEEAKRVFNNLLSNQTDCRRVILSTNIAETSLTLPHVTAVVDSGLSRVARYQTLSGDSELFTVLSSKNSIIQRKGRAGRVQNGICYHLYSNLEARVNEFEREIFIRPLYSEILLYSNFLNWLIVPDWMQSPRAQSAIDYLIKIKAIDMLNSGKIQITKLGREILQLPLSPRLGRAFLQGITQENLEAFCKLNEGVAGFNADIHKNRSMGNVHKVKLKLENYLSKQPHPLLISLSVEEALYYGFYDRVAMKGDSHLKQTKFIDFYGQTWILPQIIHSPFIIILLTHIQNNEIIDFVPMTEEQVLLHPMTELRSNKRYYFSDISKKVECIEESYIGQILYDTTKLDVSSNMESHHLVLQFIQTSNLSQKSFNQDGLEEFLTRFFYYFHEETSHLEDYSEWMKKGLLIPEISNLIAETFGELSALNYSTWKEIEEYIINNSRNALWIELEKFYPRTFRLPRGRTIKIHYEKTGVWMESRLQDFIGFSDTPTVGKNEKIPVQLRLLAPNYRPVQITTDIKSFWKNTYPELRGALSRRYPKHEWPE